MDFDKIEKAYWIKKEIASLEDQYKEIMAEIATEPGKTPYKDYLLSVTETHTFNAAQAKTSLSAAKFKKIQKLVPDAKLAKAILDPEDYAKTTKVGLRREIKLMKEE